MSGVKSDVDMSSPAAIPAPSQPEMVRDRQSSIGRAFKRLRTVLQRIGSSGGKESGSESQTLQRPSISSVPVETLVVDEELDEDHESPEETDESIVLGTGAAVDESIPPPQASVRAAVHSERTRALFAKYGLSVEAHEWVPSPAASIPSHPVLRVERPIRMRVRHVCHLCQSTIGATRECRKCLHRHCRSCVRIPQKKAKDDEDKENTISHDSDTGSDVERRSRRTKKVRSREGSPRLHGTSKLPSQPLVQRTRRSCHKCRTEFSGGKAQVCTECGHLRCSKCVQEVISLVWPSAKDETEGEDDEAAQRTERVYRRPRQRVRWVCDHCQSTFVEGSRVCTECLHQRCDYCTRIPPKRPKEDPDPGPELVHAAETRLADLTIPSTPVAGPSSPRTRGPS